MKIAIIGTGGIGAYYGARLIADGQEVHWITTARHVAAIAERGLIAHTDNDGEGVFHPASVTTNPADIGVVDVVVVTVKLYQLEAALQGIDALIGPETIVFSTQNGVTAPQVLAQYVGESHVVPGICYILAYLNGPGEVTQKGAKPALTAGPHTMDALAAHEAGEDPRIRSFVDALSRSGVAAQIDPQIRHAQWMKFALIVTFGGVCGLADSTIGEVRSYGPTAALLRESLREVQEVAGTQGIDLTDEQMEGIMARFAIQDPAGTTSMQRDIADGKPSELEELNGALVAMARETGVSVPLQETALAVLGMRAARHSQS